MTATQPEEKVPSDDRQEVDKLYNKLEKIISRIREDTSEPELLNSLRNLFAIFRKINEYEQANIMEGEVFEPLSIQRIYELASSGAGGTQIEELTSANAAFAEENKILIETIESLSFRLETLRRKSADEIMERDGIESIPTEEIQAVLLESAKVISSIDGHLKIFGGGSQDINGDVIKGLDERFLEALGEYNDVSPDLLKAIPARTTFVGKILRQFGFAYDYKDIVAVRHLICNVLKVNRQLVDMKDILLPMQEQVERIRQNMVSLEVYAGYEDRQNPQYKEAMQEIERLGKVLNRYETHQGTLDDLNGQLLSKREEIKSYEDKIQSKKKEIQALIEDEDGILSEVKKLEEEIDNLNDEHGTKIYNLERDHDKKIFLLENQIKDLEDAHRTELAGVMGRIYEIEGGLLVSKLEVEIQALRLEAEQSTQKYEQEREARIALDGRIQIWIDKEEDFKKQMTLLQKAAGLKSTFFATTAGVSALAGYGASVMLSGTTAPLLWYYGLNMAIPAVVVGLFSDEDGFGKLKNGIVAGFFGSLYGTIGLIPVTIDLERTENRLAGEYNQKSENLLKECQEGPCQLVKDADGKMTVVVFSKEKDGKRITFDFTEKDKPKIITEESLVKPVENADKDAGKRTLDAKPS